MSREDESKVEVVENCQVEWDKARGVLYVHDKDTGATVIRICRLQRADAAHVLGSLHNGQIDVTGPFEHVSYPTGLGLEEVK